MLQLTPAIRKELLSDFQEWLKSYMNERNLKGFRVYLNFQKNNSLMPKGSISRLAEAIGFKAASMSNIYSPKKMGNLNYFYAKKIAEITGTDIELWVCGGTGTPELRRAAIEAWAQAVQQ
jgi:intergrase/recombinase